MATTTTRDDQTQVRPSWPRHDEGASDNDEGARDGDTIDLTDDRRAERHDLDRDDDRRVDRHDDRRRARRGAGFAYTLRVMLSTLLLAAVVVLAAVNTADVELDYVADTTTSPQWWIIAASAVAGLIVGRLMPRSGRE